MQKIKLAEERFDMLESSNAIIIPDRKHILLEPLLFESFSIREKIVKVHMVIYCLAKNVTDEIYEEFGFESEEDMINDLKRFYPNITEETECTCIIYE